MNAIALRKTKLQGSAVAERNCSVTTQKAIKSTSINSKEGKFVASALKIWCDFNCHETLRKTELCSIFMYKRHPSYFKTKIFLAQHKTEHLYTPRFDWEKQFSKTRYNLHFN